MEKELQNKVALITGASRGIGRGIALEFARQGADLVVNATRAEALESLRGEVEALGRRCICCLGSVDDPETGRRMAAAAMEAYGRIDILVNNAGINNRKKTLELPLEDWSRMIGINENGVFFLCKAVLPYMVGQGSGSIVNITSTASKAAHPNAAICYGASKAAVTYMTKHLALEFGPSGIRVNAVQCGPIASDMTEQWTEEYRRGMMSKIPLGRLGTPADVAACAVFLGSDAASWVTGCSLNCSGGKFME